MRVPHYVEALNAAIESAAKRPFDYGSFNCGLFAAECIDAIVEGSRCVAELREQFTDEASARAFVEREGSIEAAVTKRLGEPVKWTRAQRGDVCLMPTQDGPGLGVLADVSQVAMMTPAGIAFVSVDQALAVWKVR